MMQRNINLSGYSATVLGLSFMSFTGIVFIVFNGYLPTLYIEDPEVVKMASSLLIIAALFQISDGVQAVGLGVLKGLTDVKIPMIITFFAYWLISLPVAYLLGFTFKLNITGVWIGLLFGLTVAAILFVARFHYFLKKTPEIMNKSN
jgi:MATE family multidrug resistance protein